MRTRIIIRNKEIGEIIEDFARKNYGVMAERGIDEIRREYGCDYPVFFNFDKDRYGGKLTWDRCGSRNWPGDTLLDASTQFGEIIKLLTKPKAIEVKLDDNNIMHVTKDGIRFGADVFPLSIIDDLVSARGKLT